MLRVRGPHGRQGEPEAGQAMRFIRQSFYLVLGLTFPGFWMLHASGFAAALYRPVQRLIHADSPTWPSLLTALLLYGAITAIFECLCRVIRNAHP